MKSIQTEVFLKRAPVETVQAEDLCGSVRHISALMSSPSQPVSFAHGLFDCVQICIAGCVFIQGN